MTIPYPCAGRDPSPNPSAISNGIGERQSPSKSTPSPAPSDAMARDGLLPAQEHGDVRTSAAHLAGLIPATIGWTPDQYWNATPAELAAILKALSAAAPVHQSTQPLTKTQLEQLKDTLSHG